MENAILKMIRDAYKDIDFGKKSAKDYIEKQKFESKEKLVSIAERRKDHIQMTYWAEFAHITEKTLRNPLMNDVKKMQKISAELLKTQGLVNQADEEYYSELWNIWGTELSEIDEINEEFLYAPDEYDEMDAKTLMEREG